MKQSRRRFRRPKLDAQVPAQEPRGPGPVVIHSDSDFVRCPNRGCSALLPLSHDEEQICGSCGRRWTGLPDY
jgi:hypothetical protein